MFSSHPRTPCQKHSRLFESFRQYPGWGGGAAPAEAAPGEEAPIFKHGPLQVSENKRFLVHKDGTPFFWLGDLCELVCKPLKIEPPIYRRRVAFYTKDRSFDPSKIRRLLSFENVTKEFFGNTVLREICFDLKPGEGREALRCRLLADDAALAAFVWWGPIPVSDKRVMLDFLLGRGIAPPSEATATSCSRRDSSSS